MSTDFVLQTDSLKKRFGSVQAVEDVSLSVKQAEIFGFLGPNGAGKTTTISMILGLTYPTAGKVEIFGQRVTPGHNHVLRRVGTMVGTPSLLLAFTARQNLQILARLYPDLPRQRIDEVLALVGLQAAANRKVRAFSTGMKQRMGLALALLNKPDLLILDEPTNGMDPAGMHEVRLLLRNLVEQGMTVFLSSHLLHEMELVCDRVAVVQHGHIITEGAVADMLNAQEFIHVRTSDSARTLQALQMLPGARNIEANAAYVVLQGVSSEAVLSYLVSQGIVPKEVSTSRPDLESVFLELTQKSA